MKIKYKFINDFGNLKIVSNLESNGLDLLEIISSDVHERTYKDFLNDMKNKKKWWSNATRVEFQNDEAIIYPAFEWDENKETKATIRISELKKILREWVFFLKHECK